MIPYTWAGCRHFLLAVGEMHRAGYQLVRIRPHFADSAGGGRWWCWLVPAGLRDAPPANEHHPLPFFPSFQNRRPLAFPAPASETATAILDLFPQLAAAGRGSDPGYVRWYADMLRRTDPLGLVIESHYRDEVEPPPAAEWRVLNGSGGARCLAPPPADPSLPPVVIHETADAPAGRSCASCGRPISPDRLASQPTAVRCWDCQMEAERSA